MVTVVSFNFVLGRMSPLWVMGSEERSQHHPSNPVRGGGQKELGVGPLRLVGIFNCSAMFGDSS